MLRIGVMVNSLTVDAWQYRILEQIEASDFAHVVLVVTDTPPKPVKQPLPKRIKAHWKLTPFYRYTLWDRKRNLPRHNAVEPKDASGLLKDAAVVQVEPIRKGFTDRFREEDLEKIRAAEVDVMFRFGFRIIRGPILSTAKYGVWSYHHDDNLEYRGGPSLFWEMYEKNPVSGSVLQILNESLDGGRVIYRSHSATEPNSLTLNRNPILWKTSEFAMRRLRDLHERGMEFIESLPTYNEQIPYTRGIYRTPATPRMLRFLGMQLRLRLNARLRAKRFGDRLQWFVALRPRGAAAYDSTADYSVVKPPTDRFYADPCLVERDGRTFLFFEDYRYAEGRALISCAEVKPDGTLAEAVEVLRRPYHLSYPFVLEHGGEVYLIPESAQNRTVEIYRASRFPYEWEAAGTLLDGVVAVDATIHEHNGKLWMFTGTSNGMYSNCDELSIFYADDLFGPWKPHPSNPVISDVRLARPAGALFRDGDRLIRPSQDCSVSYGYALNFCEVLVLNETEYSERRIAQVKPEWLARNEGTHTYSRSGSFEAIDGKMLIRS